MKSRSSVEEEWQSVKLDGRTSRRRLTKQLILGMCAPGDHIPPKFAAHLFLGQSSKEDRFPGDRTERIGIAFTDPNSKIIIGRRNGTLLLLSLLLLCILWTVLDGTHCSCEIRATPSHTWTRRAMAESSQALNNCVSGQQPSTWHESFLGSTMTHGRNKFATAVPIVDPCLVGIVQPLGNDSCSNLFQLSITSGLVDNSSQMMHLRLQKTTSIVHRIFSIWYRIAFNKQCQSRL